MKRSDYNKLAQVVDGIEFIERLIQLKRNSGNALTLYASMSRYTPPFIFPPNLTSLVINNLVSYKEQLEDILSSCEIVHNAVSPESPAPDGNEADKNPTDTFEPS